MPETYKHGIRVLEDATPIPEPAVTTSGVPVFIGTAPVNLAANPAAAFGGVIYAESWDEAVAALGYSEDWANYTLCQAMYAEFKAFRVAPAVFINVLDPATHKTALASQTAAVSNKQATVAVKGILLSSVVVKDGDTTLTLDEDYALSFDDDGDLVITLLGTGTLPTSLTVTGDKINPAAVTAADVIGGVDASTGVKSGLELIDTINVRHNVVVSSIVAPVWSKTATVAAAMELKCEEISGVFRAEAWIDLDASSVTKYSAVAAAKTALGLTDPHDIICWPMYKLAGMPVMALSALFAALAQYTDAQNGDRANVSPSNKALPDGYACLADGTPVYLDQREGNVVNASGVMTVIGFNGVQRSWGDETAAWPSSTDPKDHFIPIRRYFTQHDNNFLVDYHNKVDDPANFRLVQEFVDEQNIELNSEKAAGRIAGGEITYSLTENTAERIIAGEVIFHERIAPYTPGKYFENTVQFDPTLLAAAFGGE